jgi:serine phosphatase RsbU (regulator of sigma subunit)
VTCACIPAYEVGGDFYNYHTLSDHRFALAVGDVSDKGMSAALLMAISVAFFDADVTFNLPPAELLSYLDRALMRYTRATRQNCAMCYVELQDRTLHSANAGGIAPFIRRANSVERLDVSGFPLGVGIGAERGYQSVTVDLDPGDLVILTSDGVVEANASTDRLFGFERLERAIGSGPTQPHAMLDHLLNEVRDFVGNAEPHDDITVVVCQVP